ncbi:hypothetical protein HY214_05335, partial [Candidatus Roizmanbacteria bacterium]|nr:hypothetical protein [Candidatus Roizmanbacteria bacterium]
AILVGVVHGIGAETPTQLLLFITLSRAGGAVAGIALVLSFVVGLLVSNSILIAVSLLGLTRLDKSSPWYLGLGVVSGFFSLIVGFLFLTGKNGLLPAFFGG